MKKFAVLCFAALTTLGALAQNDSVPAENVGLLTPRNRYPDSGGSAKSLLDQQHDSLIRSHKMIIIGDRNISAQSYSDSLRTLIENFYYDQFHHFQDPQAPYFLFMSKDSKLAMGIGGAVRMRAYYDWGGAIPAPGFAPYLIPIPANPAKMRHFGTSPAGTCLFFRVIGQNKTLGEYQIYIEANFNGYQTRDFHLKKAYAMINDITIGYASSTFSDPAALPPTVDAQGPANKISPTTVLVRWMPRVHANWLFAVSVEDPSNQIDVDSKNTEKVDNWIPDGAAFIQYEWGRTSHVRLSGTVRALSYRDLLTAKNHNKVGWGLQLTSIAHPHPRLTTYVTANYGHGYASLGGDLLVGNYDLIADPDQPGVLYAPASYGYCIGLQYNFTPSLYASTSFSQTRFLPAKAVAPNEYRYGICGNVNIFWNMTPRMMVGAEFDYGKRCNFNGDHRWAKRIGAVAQFSF